MKLGRVYIVNTLPYFPGQNTVRVNVLGAKVYKKKNVDLHIKHAVIRKCIVCQAADEGLL